MAKHFHTVTVTYRSSMSSWGDRTVTAHSVPTAGIDAAIEALCSKAYRRCKTAIVTRYEVA